MAVRLCHPLRLSSSTPPILRRQPRRSLRCSAENQTIQSLDTRKLVLEVKEKLEREYSVLPVGNNGRDDEDMILRFLKDRKFSVEDAVPKLAKAIKWRQDFGVSGLSEECVKNMYGTGKAFVHDYLDVNARPVLVVAAAKHFPSKQDTSENEKLCVYLIEKALRKLPPGKEELLGIFDLRGFQTGNADVMFLKYLIFLRLVILFHIIASIPRAKSNQATTSPDIYGRKRRTTPKQMDVLYYYYPRRLGQVLFVEAPFIFQPIWGIFKPLLKSYASLVRFCDAETVRKEYFTEETVPKDFRN